jgi:hypothetical protein
MPIEIRQQLIDDLVKRQIEHDTATRTATHQSSDARKIDPSLLAVIGAAADGASTYKFLSDRKAAQQVPAGWQVPMAPFPGMKYAGGGEDNPLYRPLENHPLATGLAVAGTGVLTTTLINRVLRKHFPKIADTLLANQGANQIGLAGKNVGPDAPEGSAESYNRSVTQAIRRSHGQ